MNLKEWLYTILAVLISTGIMSLAFDYHEGTGQVRGVVLQKKQIAQVVDGDTIKAEIDGKTETIRLIGINTPEIEDPRKPVECFGIEASNRLKDLLDGKAVILEPDENLSDRDKYSRLLRYVRLDNEETTVNERMIAEGFAYEEDYGTNYKLELRFTIVETIARSRGVGLWSGTICS